MTLTVVRFPTSTILFLENVVRRKIRTHLDLLSVPRLGGKKCQMILVQMYNIFRLLIGVTDYSIVVNRMEKNKNM